MDDWERAGEITGKVREFGKTLIKEGVSTLEIVEKIEKKIIDLGAFPAFPAGTSINHIAAHASPFPGETTTLQKGDVVKLDLGAHINGKVADTACTVEVGTNNHKKLIEASQEALKAAADIVKPRLPVRKIGAIIDETVSGFGFNCIKNLSGHLIQEYKVHASLTIPNYDNGDETKLDEKMIIALEPFPTTGVGRVMEGKPSGIYMMLKKKPIRDIKARKMMAYIEKEYNGLPFSVRWLSHFQGYNFALRILEKEGILNHYTQLVEEGKGIVSQSEHTIKVGQGIIT